MLCAPIQSNSALSSIIQLVKDTQCYDIAFNACFRFAYSVRDSHEKKTENAKKKTLCSKHFGWCSHQDRPCDLQTARHCQRTRQQNRELESAKEEEANTKGRIKNFDVFCNFIKFCAKIFRNESDIAPQLSWKSCSPDDDDAGDDDDEDAPKHSNLTVLSPIRMLNPKTEWFVC